MSEPAARSSFLADLHATFGLPRSTVVRLTARATGREVLAVRRVVRGDENEVYRVELGGGQVVYPRIRRPGIGGVDGEVWAMEQARSAGAPVPEVLAVEALLHEGVEREAMVVSAAPGRQLATVMSSLSSSERHATFSDLGRALAVVHAVPSPGCWRPSYGPDASRWPERGEWARTHVEDRMSDLRNSVRLGFTSAEIDRMHSIVEETVHNFAPEQPVLCHGDIYPEHVFIDDDGRVCGLIDWGLWRGGTAVADLAWASIRHDSNDFASLLQGHGTGSAADAEFMRAIAKSALVWRIQDIAWRVSVGDSDGSRLDIAALRRNLALK